MQVILPLPGGLGEEYAGLSVLLLGHCRAILGSSVVQVELSWTQKRCLRSQSERPSTVLWEIFLLLGAQSKQKKLWSCVLGFISCEKKNSPRLVTVFYCKRLGMCGGVSTPKIFVEHTEKGVGALLSCVGF